MVLDNLSEKIGIWRGLINTDVKIVQLRILRINGSYPNGTVVVEEHQRRT